MNTIFKTNKISDYFFPLLIIALFFLRFPFAILLSFHKLPIPSNVGLNILLNGTCLITAILIILKLDFFLALFIFISAPIAGLLGEYLFAMQL